MTNETSYVVSKSACPKCVAQGKDTSGNNLATYSDGGQYCWGGCGIIKSSYKEKIDYEKEYEVVGSEFSPAVVEGVKSITSYDPKGWRGLRKDTCEYLGIRHEYDTQTGKIKKQYYPCTIKGGHSGWKVRHEPKDFSSIGTTGKEADLFNWFRFQKSTQKKCVISSGEIDAISAFQMLSDYTKKKGQEDYGFVPVVSGTLGEKAVSQIKAAYEWFDKFDQIIICYDNDDVGREAVEDVVKVLPRGKVYVMDLVLKDANEYLKQGKEAEFVNIFFKARKYTLKGITGSSGLLDKMREYVSMARITLPNFLHKLQEKLRGGLPIGYVINLLAASGAGKSTFVDSMILHWILNTEYPVGIVSLEASEGEYGVNIGSAYIQCKINLGITPEDRLASINDHEQELLHLFTKPDGSDRFYIVDPDVDIMKQKIEYLVISLGCKIIVIDPIQDIFDALPDDKQAEWMKWEKDLVKREQCTIINISHSRKAGGGQKAGSQGASLSEEDMMGHSSIYKSGGINIIISRNKEAESEDERNTTIMKVTKARGVGFTGFVGEYYYHNETHQLWDKEDWIEHSRVPKRA